MTMVRFKHFLKDRNQFSRHGDETLLSVSEYYGVKPRAEAFEGEEHESRAATLEGYRIVQRDDLVMNYMLAWKGAYGVSDHDGIVSPAYSVFVINKQLADPRFIHHRTRSADMRALFRSRSKGIIESRLRLYPDALLAMDISLPDLPTQKAIADFLDRETARIDLLIEKKQRLVELLRERSASAVETAITTTHPLTKLGHHVSVVPGFAFASAEFSDDDAEIRLLRGTNINPGKINWNDTVFWPRRLASGLDRFQLAAGDIVMGMDRPWVSDGIRVAELSQRDVPSLLLQRVCKIIPRETLVKDFLLLLLMSRNFLGYFEPELTGVSVPHISGDQICRFRFGYVPVVEQERRASACRQTLNDNQHLIDKAQLSIDRLREFRAALITATVTGQIDPETWSRRGTTDRRLDQIAAEMSA